MVGRPQDPPMLTLLGGSPGRWTWCPWALGHLGEEANVVWSGLRGQCGVEWAKRPMWCGVGEEANVVWSGLRGLCFRLCYIR